MFLCLAIDQANVSPDFGVYGEYCRQTAGCMVSTIARLRGVWRVLSPDYIRYGDTGLLVATKISSLVYLTLLAIVRTHFGDIGLWTPSRCRRIITLSTQSPESCAEHPSQLLTISPGNVFQKLLCEPNCQPMQPH